MRTTKKRPPQGIQYEPYPNCPFCGGKGCFGCKERKNLDEATARKAEQDKRHLEESLLFTAHYDNPEEMATLQQIFHADKLREVFDASDLTEEDVFKHLGRGNIEQGQQMFLVALEFAKSRYAPWECVSSDHEVRQLALDRVKQQIASERGNERMREALRGRPGAGPHV